MSDLVLNDDENSLDALQEAMGMSLDLNSKTKTSTLARLKLLHEPVTAVGEIKGKTTEYTVIEAGVFELTLRDGTKIYQKNPTVRLFLQRFMYQRYVLSDNRYVKTTLATTLQKDLPDVDGGFNCGRQAGYIEDFNSLPQEQKDVDRVRTVLGEIYFDNAKDETGEEINGGADMCVPFIGDFKKEGFKAFEIAIKTIAQKNKLLPHCMLELNTESRKGQSGLTYYVPTVTLRGTDLPINKKDKESFQNFLAYVDVYNQGVLQAHGSKDKEGKHLNGSAVLEKEAEDVVDVSEPKKKIAKKAVQQQKDEDLVPIM